MNPSTRATIFFISAFLCLSKSIIAEELFTHLSSEESSLLEQQHGYNIKKITYFSKAGQYSLVTLNTELLKEQSTSFELTPFENKKLSISINEFKKPNYGSVTEEMMFWKGVVSSPIKKIDNPLVASLANKVSLLIQGATTKSTTLSAPEKLDERSYQTIYGTVTSSYFGETYKIVPLPNSPEIHVIFSLDNNKELSDGPGDESKRRKKNYTDYMKKLNEEYGKTRVE